MTVENTHAEHDALRVFAGGGEMGRLCREMDWAATPLGPVEGWPQSLKTAAGMVITSAFPNLVLWGPDLVQIYNDGYIPITGAKHPWALGRPTREVWPEVWHLNGPLLERAIRGESVSVVDAPYPLRRGGPDAPPEDTFFTLSFSPIRDEAGAVGGVLVSAFETTAQVERARLFEELQLERSRLAFVFQQAPAFLAVQRGPQHTFELVNDAYYQLVGHRDSLGKPMLEALPEIRGQGFTELLNGVMETGEPFIGREIPVLLVRTPGATPEERFIDLTYMPLVEADGTCSGVIAHGTDVTEHVRARREVERLLKESEEVRQALEAANTQLEEQALELELSNQQLQEQASELEMQAEEIQATAVALEERTWEAEHAAAALVEGEERLRLAMGAGGLGAWDLDLGTETLTASDSCKANFGRRPEDPFTYADWFASIHPDDRSRVRNSVRHALENHTDYSEEYRVPLPDGAMRWIAAHGHALYDAAGAPVRMAGVTQDVTARREAEEVVRQARDAAEEARAEAEAANRAKSEFLANMSHELRTPINAIVGYTDLLELGIAGPVTEGQRAQLARIRASSRHLTGLIDDILDLAKIEAGRMEVALEHAPVVTAVVGALALVGPQAARRGIEIQDACAADVFYVGNEDRVRQVLANLLSNAVKFTEPGGRIRITCGTARETDPGTRVLEKGPLAYVRVEDTGIGIAPEQIENIFHPFVQAETGHTRSRGGTGLGLTISRRLARLMGGDLTAESEPGEGSVFTLWLPSESALGSPVAETILEEVREERPRGLAAVGEALREEIDPIVEAFVRRLREDTLVPMATDFRKGNLEDHTAVFLADVAQALIALQESDYDVADLVRDGTEIQRVIAELHGAQRARLGWSEEALRREYGILREEVERVVRRKALAEADVGGALRLLVRLLDHAERTSLHALRLARAAGEPSLPS